MDWKQYAWSFLLFSLLSTLAVYLLLRAQAVAPAQPGAHGRGVADDRVQYRHQFRDQHQLAGVRRRNDDELPVADAGAHRAELRFRGGGHGSAVALIRGLSRHSTRTIGSFWVDLTRGTLYILLPLSFVLALALVSQGVVQTFGAYQTVPLLQPFGPDTARVTTQTIAVGPAASQIAIKQLGTNGGGFFNINSAHPFENATPLSNFLEVLAILVIPAALCYTFGRMVKDTRQGWAVLAAMTIVFVGLLLPCVVSEQGWQSVGWPPKSSTSTRASARLAAIWRARRSGSGW